MFSWRWQEKWKMDKKKKLAVLAGAAVILALAGSFCVKYWISRGEVAQNSDSRMQAVVTVQTLQKKDLLKRIVLSGQTVPEAQVDITAKYQGKIVSVNTELGQKVSAGQVLVVQDTGDVELSLLQNQASYEQAAADTVVSDVSFRTSLEKAKADYQRYLTAYNRYKTLYEVGAIAKDALDQAEQQMIGAKTAMDSYADQLSGAAAASVASKQAAAVKARHSVAALEKQRDDMILRAPRDGVIGYRQVEAGMIVQPGQKLLSLYDNSKIYVDCQLSEQDLPAVWVGMDVNVNLESIGKVLPGKIVYISPANDPQNLSFSLRIALSSVDATVKTGMFTKTTINAILRPQVLTVPKDAVQDKNGESFVFVVDGKNTVEQRTVRVGARGDEEVEILSGLQAGEQIALNNLARLRSGMVIRPRQAGAEDRGEGQ